MATSTHPPHRLSAQVRERWVRQLAGALDDLDAPLREYLARPLPAGVDSMVWMEAGMDWPARGADCVARARQRLLRDEGDRVRDSGLQPLSLLDDEAIDDQIAAGRLAVAVLDGGQDEFNDLRLRLQHLDRTEELAKTDRVMASRLCEDLLRAWIDSGMTRPAWAACQPLLRRFLADAYAAANHQANVFLLEHGVLPEVNLRARIRKPSPGAQRALAQAAGAPAEAGGAAAAPGRGRWSQAAEEVGGRLRRLLADKVPVAARWLATPTGGGQASAPQMALDPALAFELTQAITRLTAMADWSTVEGGVLALRQQTRAIKAAASNDRDKAVIEVVALIFDSILAEERIPPNLRVWFARLQMPVLRVAVVDQDFLGSTDHPARRLIDRMGSCVLGFDPGVSLAPLEAEIKRVVQVVEQYPETGRRVFELVLEEFQQFLQDHLIDQGGAARVANLAQQVEQKETLAVKFTIELRKLLGTAPVRQPVRDFLFKAWVEVLAVASVRYGPQHAESARLRQAAADLLWMAGAKPSRQERAQVIARLPALLATLREGLALLGLSETAREGHIQRLSDALAEAFTSRDEPVAQDWLDGITSQLARLEDFISDDEPDHIELDQDSIEWITGVDASGITVVPDTGFEALPALKAWAAELPLGAWFELDHNHEQLVVQLAWKSARGQFLLFVAPDQRCFLLQQGRVAQYLDTGLLRAREAEALTVRATRQALDKLDANPERLLA